MIDSCNTFGPNLSPCLHWQLLFVFQLSLFSCPIKSFFYRPQRSWAKVIFSQACVCPRGGGAGGGVSASVHAGIPPQSRHPLGADPPGADTPLPRGRPPPPKADCSIRLTSARYASYWNAFLFGNALQNTLLTLCRNLCSNEAPHT